MNVPRLLLFGTPGAGKSSLLGALAQASATQASTLKGQLVDAGGELKRLLKSTYEARPAAIDEQVTYDLKLQPAEKTMAATEAKLIDCSGKLAQAMLKAKEPFDDAQPMKNEILDADAVLLLLDASNKPLGEEFQQFVRWLTELHEERGERTDIAELPVFIVLTKCDLLAKKDDTFSKWTERIEEAKRKIDQKVREALKEQEPGFGTLDLRVWATSIKRPAFADRPAKAQEPYGVAELFRQCLPAAANFLERRQTSQSRLQNVVVGLAGVVTLLGLALVFAGEYQPEKWIALDEQVQTALPKKDAKAVQRLGGTLKKLEEREKRLTDIEVAPGFEHLPHETRDAVERYRREIEQYRQLSEDFKTKVKFPFMAKTEQEFLIQEKNLNELKLPDDWQDTQLGKRAEQCVKEYVAVRKALGEREAWMHEQIKKNNGLLDQGSELQVKLRKNTKLGPQEVELWVIQYRNQEQARPAALQSDPIPGASGVSYEFLEKFQAIKDARKKWDAGKVQLRRVAENIQELKAG